MAKGDRKMSLLQVLDEADFDWVKLIDNVWGEDDADIQGIHKDVRDAFAKALADLKKRKAPASPLGWVVAGPGGSGKTHLLGAFRETTLKNGGFFIVVDMSGVKNFWETLLLHMMRSIRKPDLDGRAQLFRLLDSLVAESRCNIDAGALPGMFRDDLAGAINMIVSGLYGIHDIQTTEFQDVVRAVVMVASSDIKIATCGRIWLQGLESDAEDMKAFGFTTPAGNAQLAVAGLSWMMSLNKGFSVLALDQLDAIVKQHYVPDVELEGEEAVTARRIIVGICDGLTALHDTTRRSLVVVSCLTNTWKSLSEFGLSTAVDRYRKPIHLSFLSSEEQAGLLVTSRMKRAFACVGEKAPYPTWPFPPAVIREMSDMYPRMILQMCDQHVRNCLVEGVAREATIDSADEPESVPAVAENDFQKRIDAIDARYREEWEKVVPDVFKAKEREDDFWRLALGCFGRAFKYELPPMADADVLLDDDTDEDRNNSLLHAKLRYVTMGGRSKDRLLGIRALLMQHYRSFQSKLKSAMTQSGIDRKLSFRKLALIHFGKEFPGKKVTDQLLEQFAGAGGVWVEPSDDVIRSLAALVAVEEAFPMDWRGWIDQKKPVRDIVFLQPELAWLLGDTGASNVESATEAPAGGESNPPESPVVEIAEVVVDVAPARTTGRRKGADAMQRIPVGKKQQGAAIGEEVSLLLETLQQHTAIWAGSGSGKTVLTRRLVEEAALCGTPAIVIDIANDLARLGQPWPEEPPSWTDEDREKAKRYFERVEVKIWTPGKSGGNPLYLRQMPDFAAVADDPDDLASAVGMGISTLRDVMKINNSIKSGIVGSAMKWMARNGGGGLEVLAETLSELPEDSGALDIHEKAQRMASEMAAHLKGTLVTSPLLAGSGDVTDIGQLLTGSNGKTRISVVNLSGFGDNLEDQQQFINQLAMTLFGWIKKNPANGLGGLFVMDEAKDFIPSQRTTPCKDSMIRYAAQARKYGMGLIIATQEPKSVDTKIISNTGTQFFGRLNSPATIEAAESLLDKYGVIRGLTRGCFYLKSVEMGGASVRMAAPMCLSYHAPSAPTPEEVLELARQG